MTSRSKTTTKWQTETVNRPLFQLIVFTILFLELNRVMRHRLHLLSHRIDSSCCLFRQALSDFWFYSVHFKFSIKGRIFSLSVRYNRKILTPIEGIPPQIHWLLVNLSSGTKSTPIHIILNRHNSILSLLQLLVNLTP